MAAGVYGFDGLMGILFYLCCDLMLGVIMVTTLGFSAKPYFKSLRQVVMTGLLGNVMTFMVVWVLIHNLVYIL